MINLFGSHKISINYLKIIKNFLTILMPFSDFITDVPLGKILMSHDTLSEGLQYMKNRKEKYRQLSKTVPWHCVHIFPILIYFKYFNFSHKINYFYVMGLFSRVYGTARYYR